jgi:hypothetical protein
MAGTISDFGCKKMWVEIGVLREPRNGEEKETERNLKRQMPAFHVCSTSYCLYRPYVPLAVPPVDAN